MALSIQPSVADKPISMFQHPFELKSRLVSVGWERKLSKEITQSTRDSEGYPANVDNAQVKAFDLHAAFDPSAELQHWDPKRFELQKVLSNAARNQGKVSLMWDTLELRFVAAKQMPNSWIGMNHADFLAKNKGNSEWPWQDIGCTRYLNSIKYPYACTLFDVHQNTTETAVMTSFATEGDLFSWNLEHKTPPGPDREDLVRPLAVQMMKATLLLHDLSIVHGDISLENFVITKDAPDAVSRLNIIDFGAARTDRYSHGSGGKPSYIAPESRNGGMCDGFLADAFAVGVTLHCLLLSQYPWQSTKACDKAFDYVQQYGFRAYAKKRKMKNTNTSVEETLSEPAIKLLEGLLSLDPSTRHTLGESVWSMSQRKSVWDEEWL